MASKKNIVNNEFFECYSKKEKAPNLIKNFKRIGINTYTNDGKDFRISEKKNKQNNLTIIHETKNRQKQIKKYLIDSYKKEGVISRIIENNKIKELNISEIKTNKHDKTIKNIKVNRINIDDIHKENGITQNTNRNFYNRPLERNKSFNLSYNEKNKFQNKINSNNLYYYLNNHKKNQRKSNIISVKSFNKNKDFINDHLLYSDYINLISPFNQDYSNFSFYDYNILNNKISNNSKNNLTNNTFTNFTTTGVGKSQTSHNSSKVFINFKNLKTFYAHLEILISLYLKRNFKYFIEKVTEYNKQKSNNLNLYKNLNKNGPIINVNNAHCSLFCSININQDSNNNSSNNRLFNTVFNSNNTPLTKINEVENDESKLLNKDFINNIKKSRLVFVKPENFINLNETSKIGKKINKSVYIPKNKITKFNDNDTINDKKIKEIKEYKKINQNLNEIKNIKNDIRQSSPIKEMNINLKKINVCRLNELNQLYSNLKLYNNNSSGINFSEINNFLNLNNNNSSHSKFNSNNINNDNNNNNLNDDKYKLKKISSAKNGVYIKPKEKIKKKIIKEIKIQNNQNKMNSPFKKEVNNQNKKNKNLRIENLVTISNSFFNNKNTEIYPINCYTNNNSQEKNIIKKIYIRRNSKNQEKEENNLDSNKNNCLSTLLSFKKESEKIEKNEVLIKQIKTSDLRMFINIKYVILKNKDKIKRNNKFDLLSLKNEHNNSISIIENKIILAEYSDNTKDNITFEVSDIFVFDNDKKEKNKKNLNKTLIEFVSKAKENIIKNIKKYIIIIFKRNIFLNKIILKNNKKLVNFYFSKLKNEIIEYKSNINKNSYGIYHKINYNDDFNLNKRMKTPNNFKKYNNIQCKTKAYNLTSKLSINQNKIKVNNKNKNKRRELSSNFNSSLKYINKEINIVVHNNNSISDKANKIKNKLFLFRSKLIKSILKK